MGQLNSLINKIDLWKKINIGLSTESMNKKWLGIGIKPPLKNYLFAFFNSLVKHWVLCLGINFL